MPRGTTLSTLRSMLKAAIGDNATGNTSRDAELNTLLSNEQRLLASSYDFPFLEHRWDLTCAAGSRFLNLPTATSATGDLGATLSINFDRAVKVMVKFNSVWLPVSYGISDDELTVFDSDEGEAADPIQRWRLATNTSEATYSDMVEIWPLPVTAQTVRFTGQRQLVALTSDSDKCDLDDMLIVYSVAIKKATRASLVEEARAHLASARQRELQVRAGYPEVEDIMILGEPCYGRRAEPRRGATFIGVAARQATQTVYDGVWANPNGFLIPTTPSLPAFYRQKGISIPNIWGWDTVAQTWYEIIVP